jgi:hypothetical protein
MLATGLFALALASATQAEPLGVWVLTDVAGKPLPRYDRPLLSLIEFETGEVFGGCATGLSFEAKARVENDRLTVRDLAFGRACIPNQPAFRSPEQITFRRVLEACAVEACEAKFRDDKLSIRDQAGERLTFKRYAPVTE